jgi:hypothetical protein
MTSEHLPPPLETSLAVVREWLDKTTVASTNPDLDLRNLRAVLIHLLEIVEHDPTIDAATDNLADAASAYLKEVELAAGLFASRRWGSPGRLMHVSQLRLE